MDSTSKQLEVKLRRAIQKNNDDSLKTILKGMAECPSDALLWIDSNCELSKGSLKLLIRKGADVNATDGFHRTPLILGIEKENGDYVNVLLKHGADINIADNHGNTALIVAAQGNGCDEEFMSLLVNRGADVNATDCNGQTALMHVISNEDCNDMEEVVKILLSEGDVNARDNDGKTALLHAISVEDPDSELLEFLFKSGADVNACDKNGKTALLYATSREDLSNNLIEMLCERGADVNACDSNGLTALLHTLSHEELDVDCIRTLVHQGADINAFDDTGKSTLLYTISRDIELATHLIDQGADVNIRDSDGKTALMHALSSKDIDMECIRMLLHQGADVNVADDEGKTALLYASSRTFLDMEVISLLIDSGADVQRCDEHRKSVLMNVVSGGKRGKYQEECIGLCIAYGAPVNVADASGMTAAMYAVIGERGNSRHLSLLLDNGADVNAANQNGQTMLIQAISGTEKQKECTSLLIAFGADVNARDNVGRTALMYAVAGNAGNTKYVDLLMKNEADVNAKDENGRTVLMYAVSGDQTETSSRTVDIADTDNGNDNNFSLKCANLLIDNHAGVNTRAKNGNTALIYAIKEEDLECIRLLVAYGADVNACDEAGKSTLLLALEGKIRPKEMATVLIDLGADVNTIDPIGKTALMYAVESLSEEDLDLEFASLLLDRGANVNSEDLTGKTALLYALSRNDIGTQFARLLVLMFGANINVKDNTGRTALMYPKAEKEGTEFTKLLIKRGAEINVADKHGKNALIYAAMSRKRYILEALLDHGLDANIRDNEGKSALIYAVSGDNLDKRSRLTRVMSVNDSKDDKAANGNKDRSEDEENENSDESDATSKESEDEDDEDDDDDDSDSDFGDLDQNLSDSAEDTSADRAECAVLLITYNAHVNISDKYGKTALMYAVSGENIAFSMDDIDNEPKSTASILVHHGADINARDETGKTAIIHAARWNNLPCVLYFAMYGADVNAVDNSGRTVLSYTQGFTRGLRFMYCYLTAMGAEDADYKQLMQLNPNATAFQQEQAKQKLKAWKMKTKLSLQSQARTSIFQFTVSNKQSYFQYVEHITDNMPDHYEMCCTDDQIEELVSVLSFLKDYENINKIIQPLRNSNKSETALNVNQNEVKLADILKHRIGKQFKKGRKVKQDEKIYSKSSIHKSNVQYERMGIAVMRPFIDFTKCVGQGGFGKVYRGKSRYRNVQVVVKISQEVALGTSRSTTYTASQFKRELLTAPIKNPFIVPIFAVTEEVGKPYHIMYPYMEGTDLEKRLFKCQTGKELTWRQRVQIACHVSQGLLAYHKIVPGVRNKPILHRDIKPGNILLDKNDNACLSDPSLAKEMDAKKTHVSGVVISGTNGYIDPDIYERYLKEKQKYTFYARNDVYSFGIVMLQMLMQMGPLIDDGGQQPLVTYLETQNILDFNPNVSLNNNVSSLSEQAANMWPRGDDGDAVYTRNFCEIILQAFHSDTEKRIPLDKICKELKELCKNIGQARFNFHIDDLKVCVGCKVNTIAKGLSLRSPRCKTPSAPCCFYCKECYLLAYRNPLVCPMHGPAEPPIGHGNTYAVVVAGYHTDAKGDVVPGGDTVFARDAIGISNALKDSRMIGGLREGVHLFTFTPAKGNCTSKAILHRIKELGAKIATLPDATFIFYYSGHCNGDDLFLKNGESIEKDDLRSRFENMKKAVEVLVIMDCCFAASFDTLTRSSSHPQRNIDKIPQSPVPVVVNTGLSIPIANSSNIDFESSTYKARATPASTTQANTFVQQETLSQGHSSSVEVTQDQHESYASDQFQSDSSRFCQMQWSASSPDQTSSGPRKNNTEYSLFTKYLIAGLHSGSKCAFQTTTEHANAECHICEKFRKLSAVEECVTLPNLQDYVSKHMELEIDERGLPNTQQPQIDGSMRGVFKMAYYNSEPLNDEYPCYYGETFIGTARIPRTPDDFGLLKHELWSSLNGILPCCVESDDLVISSNKMPICNSKDVQQCKARGRAIELCIYNELKQLTTRHAVFYMEKSSDIVLEGIDDWMMFVNERNHTENLLPGVTMRKVQSEHHVNEMVGWFQLSVPRSISIDFTSDEWSELGKRGCNELQDLIWACKQTHSALNIQVFTDGFIKFKLKD
ncbi:unnamed protein product [Owenia fusiformis]|uniref:Protein kinase domain-containing protein n=1 Tax=Owenia fusiformis TaxID=6347 RepID=A0A8S4PR47_OWEFU|nr:unnamed protein product [Owenia fusiformis]